MRRRSALEERLRLTEALLTKRAVSYLRSFVAQAWPILEPAAELLPNRHIDAIAEHLEAVTAGDLTRLV